MKGREDMEIVRKRPVGTIPRWERGQGHRIPQTGGLRAPNRLPETKGFMSGLDRPGGAYAPRLGAFIEIGNSISFTLGPRTMEKDV